MSDSLRPLDCTAHGILQARILERVAVPFFRGSSQPRDGTQVSCISGRLLTSWAAREEHVCVNAGWGVSGGQVQTTEKLFENFGYSWEQREKARIGRGDGLKRCLSAWEELDHDDEMGPRERNVGDLERQLKKTGGNGRNVAWCCPWRGLHRTLYKEVRARAGNCRPCTGTELTQKNLGGWEICSPVLKEKMARRSNIS